LRVFVGVAIGVWVAVGMFVEVRVAVGVAVGGAERDVEQPSGSKVKMIMMKNLTMFFIMPTP
jgi:hypothetical protein